MLSLPLKPLSTILSHGFFYSTHTVCGSAFLSIFRTKRWTWNRSTSVWTASWTRTWLTSSCRVSLSRSLPWTLAACSPANPWRPCLFETTQPIGGRRHSLWPPSSRRVMGQEGHWAQPLAGPCPCPSAVPPCPLSAANTGHPTGGSSGRVQSRHPCQCPTNQCQEDPSQKPASPATGHPSEHAEHSQTLKLKQNSGELNRVLTVWRGINKTLKNGFLLPVMKSQWDDTWQDTETLMYIFVSTKRERSNIKKCILNILNSWV